jgi:flagellin
MSSILTNTSAMVALQTLKGVNKGLGKVQNEVSTGLKVATAKDNSSSWSIASTMKSDVSTFKKLGEALTSASAMVGVARNAAEQVSDIVRQIQDKMVQAGSPDADTVKLGEDITALTETIASIALSAQYNGINLVSGAATDQDITTSVIRDATGVLTIEQVTATAWDIEGIAATIAALAVDGSAASLDAIDDELDFVNEAAASFGAAQARIEAQNAFASKQADALKEGVGALVDADMEEASARLQALQVQQQLGIQALSIANQNPQNILSLFR